MESHPIPQQISSYQFRLVGDMTLKQFFQIAGGALVSIVIYSLPLLGIIKWPLVIASALLGIALAFLPLEERPLEHWILAFLRSIYSPTMFYWKRGSVNAKFFQDEAATPSEKILYPGGEEKLKEYLETSASDKLSGKLEKIESAFLSGLTGMFNVFPNGKLTTQTETPTVEASQEVKKPLAVPQTPFVKVPVIQAPPKLVVEETSSQGKVEQVVPITPVYPVSQNTEITAEKSAQFSIDAAPPSPPTTPNTLTGQVIDTEKRLIEGAIMEIKDSFGRPVRALKSNKLGHFMVVTPLQNGKYEIITEKDGFSFEPLTFDAAGQIIPPIAITGKKIQETETPNVARPVHATYAYQN